MKVVGIEWSTGRCFGISLVSREAGTISHFPEGRALSSNVGEPG